jgi:hypothetical protein
MPNLSDHRGGADDPETGDIDETLHGIPERSTISSIASSSWPISILEVIYQRHLRSRSVTTDAGHAGLTT